MAEKNHPKKKTRTTKTQKFTLETSRKKISLFHCDVNYIFGELDSLNPETFETVITKRSCAKLSFKSFQFIFFGSKRKDFQKPWEKTCGEKSQNNLRGITHAHALDKCVTIRAFWPHKFEDFLFASNIDNVWHLFQPCTLNRGTYNKIGTIQRRLAWPLAQG